MIRLGLTLTLVAATAAHAQLNTVPMTYAPPPGPAEGLGTGTVLVARGLNDDSGEYWSVAALLDFGAGERLQLGGALGTVQALQRSGGRELRLQAAGTIALRLVRAVSPDGSGTTSVSLLTGLGYAPLGDDMSELNVPIGFGIARTIELGGLAVEAWTVPRFAIRRVEIQRERATQLGAGLSTGATVGFSLGAALVAAIEYRNFGDEREGGRVFPRHAPVSAALGLRFRSGI